jgi:hypothetical protein
MHPNLKAKCFGILTVLLLAASLASAQIVNVSPVAGNPTASGTALLNALAGITDASTNKWYVIRLAPGNYDVGSTGLVMKPYVDIEGAGSPATRIMGLGNNTSSSIAVIKGASSAELRNLGVVSLGQGYTYSVALLIDQSITSVRNVSLTSSNAAVTVGLLTLSSDSVIESLIVDLIGGTTSYGISTSGTGGLAPTIRHAVINSSGATNSFGIYSENNAVPVVRDADILVSATNAYGIGINRAAQYSSAAPYEVTNSKIVATSSHIAVGIDLNGHDAVTASFNGNYVPLSASCL